MPNSTNGTPACLSDADSMATRGVKTLAYCVIIIVALLGNATITFIVFRIKSMRRTINYFIANMALSDFLLVIFVYPRIITELYWGQQRWLVGGLWGLALCKLDYFFQDVSTAVSIQSLMLIAVDRFNAVVFPLRPPLFSSKGRRIAIPITWLVAMGLHAPYLLAFRLNETPNGLFCSRNWEKAFGTTSSLRNYYVALFLILALFPFFLMALLYSVIIIKLKQQKFPGHQSVNSKELHRRLKRDRNVLTMAIAIVVGFAFCWAPVNVYAFLLHFVWEPNLGCATRTFYFVVFFLAYSNCAVNPCICFIFSQNYRNALKGIFGCFSCECKLPCVRPLQQRSWTLRSSRADTFSPPDMGITLSSIN